MDTIDAFEKEIAMQLDFAKEFLPPERLSEKRLEKAIFCGTGDSFASAQLAEIFSNFKARAYDPLDLLKNRQLFDGRDIYLISISGNTQSNIDLAKLAKRTVAITADGQSRLGRACRDRILLNFPSAGIQTAGSISFLASALTCISLVSTYGISDIPRIYQDAVKSAKGIALGNKTYILGNMHTMPVAMFCAAKLNEVLGIDAHYERIEQFSHMSLFSAKKGDSVILFEPKNTHNQRLLNNLKRYGIRTIRLEPKRLKLQEQILFFIFASELIALYAAKKKRKKDCFFIEENELRNVSSSMIY